MDLYYISHTTSEKIFLKGVCAKTRVELASKMGEQFEGNDGEIYLNSEVYATNIFNFNGFEGVILGLLFAIQFTYCLDWSYGLYSFFWGLLIGQYHNIHQKIKVNNFNLSKFKLPIL